MSMMTRRCAFSLLALASILSSSMALPLDARQPGPQISVVNVDGSSNPTTTTKNAPIETVTQTVSSVRTQTVSEPASVFTATINVDYGTATETVYLTVTPSAAPRDMPLSSAMPFGAPPPDMPVPSSTLSTVVAPLSTGTPCDDDGSVNDGAPWHTRYPIPTATGTAAYPAAYPTTYPTGGYDEAVAPPPADMTAPFPVLPPQETPFWYNETQVPNYRKRAILNA